MNRLRGRNRILRESTWIFLTTYNDNGLCINPVLIATGRCCTHYSNQTQFRGGHQASRYRPVGFVL